MAVSTPTSSRPRARISAIVEPGGTAVVAGPVGRRLASGTPQSGSGVGAAVVVVVDVGPGSDSGTSACTHAAAPAITRQATIAAHRPDAARPFTRPSGAGRFGTAARIAA